MTHNFNNIPSVNIERSVFNRDSGLKTAFDVDYLVPIYVDEMVPGDTFHVTEHVFGRLSTPVKPFMDNLWLETFYFVVPNRLLWQNWKRMNGETNNPTDETDFLVPVLFNQPDGYTRGELHDYFGLPVGLPISHTSALPFRAYNKIWNEWFRDQNLQDSLEVATDDGPDDSFYFLQKRNKRPDYFTSCLPWHKKGTRLQCR